MGDRGEEKKDGRGGSGGNITGRRAGLGAGRGASGPIGGSAQTAVI